MSLTPLERDKADESEPDLPADPVNKEFFTAWAKDDWAAKHFYSAGGGRVNFKMNEGAVHVKTTYRANDARLVEVKTKYDPDNLLHVNQNIRPEQDANPGALHP